MPRDGMGPQTIHITCESTIPRPRSASATAPPPADPLLSRLLRKKENRQPKAQREGWADGMPPPHRDFQGEKCGAASRRPSARASTTSYLFSQFLTNSRSDRHATLST